MKLGEAKNAAKDVEIAQLRKQDVFKDSEIARLLERNDFNDSEIVRLLEQNSFKDSEIARLLEKTAFNDSEIARLVDQNSFKDFEIARLVADIAGDRDTISEQRARLKKLQDDTDYLHSQNQRLGQQISELLSAKAHPDGVPGKFALPTISSTMANPDCQQLSHVPRPGRRL